MSSPNEKTVLFSGDCIERCGVLPDLRHNEQGNVEAFIPSDGASDVSDGEWVAVAITRTDSMVVITCEPTSDGFKAVYKTTPERYKEAWDPAQRHRKRIYGVPRQCGVCGDRLDNIHFETTTKNGAFCIEANGQTYCFKANTEMSDDYIKPELVRLVVNYMKRHNTTDAPESTFLEVLQQALQETFAPSASS